MQCEQVKDMLSLYIDGMTGAKDNTVISAHLKDCSQCRQELEQLRALRIALKNLSVPELPESFAEELRRRLAEENTILFSPRKIKKPKKQGWIAAGVAGVALIAGIYASSVLPLAPMIASWQDKHSDNKPSVVINGIISHTHTGKEKKSPDMTQTPEAKPEETRAANNSASKKVEPQASSEQNGGTPKTDVSTPEIINPKLADVFSTRLKVRNADDSLKQVVRLAQNSGWNYEYTDNGAVPQALSGPHANGLAIKVNKNDVDKVIGALGGVGKVSSPMHSQVELTEQYGELENQIDALQKEKQNLRQAESPDEAKMSAIERQIQDTLRQKAALDQELQMVTVNIYFVEEVNP